ncbi:MAG: hypothetical protein ACYC8T_21180 [Myxococcaceae bacterium]
MSNETAQKPAVDPPFAPTQALEPVASAAPPSPPASPATTGEVARAATRRVAGSLLRRVTSAAKRGISVAWARVEPARRWTQSHPRATAAACVGLGAVLAIAVSPSHAKEQALVDSALSRRDMVSALALARAADQDGAGPAEAILRAQLALELREHREALEALERAQRAGADISKEPAFIALAIQTYNAGSPARTTSLLAKGTKEQVVEALQVATTDWSYRVRHGAAGALKALGVAVQDPVALGLLDVWQLERCDQRAAVASKLLATRATDERIVPGLEAAAKRPADDGCLREILPTRAAAR